MSEETRYKYRINEIFARTGGNVGDKDAALAEAVGKSKLTIRSIRLSRIGSNYSISTDLLIKIAAELKVTPGELLNYEREPAQAA